MKYQTYVVSHGGNIRGNNEDNAYLNGYYRQNNEIFFWGHRETIDNNLLAAVFDGMGGEENGEVASRMAAESISEYQKYQFSTAVENYIFSTNNKICLEQQNGSMGTTYVGLSIEEDHYYFSNLGDSRGYLFRNGVLKQITKDHNMVQDMLLNGILTEEQAKKHPDRHAIYQFLGLKTENYISVEAYEAEVITAKKGDICLLCSDGLTDMVSDEEICGILSENLTVIEKAGELVYHALDHGGVDNITVLVIEARG